MWRDEKTEYLRRNRDYSRLLDIDDGEAQTPRRQNRGRSKDRQIDADDGNVSPDRQEYLDRRRRLKELERQKLTKGKNGVYNNVRRDEVSKGGEQNRDRGSSRIGGAVVVSNEKKKLPYDRSFGSFFGPSEPVVAKRIIEEARAREEAEIVAARDAAKAKVEDEVTSTEGSASCACVPTPAHLITLRGGLLKHALGRKLSLEFKRTPQEATAAMARAMEGRRNPQPCRACLLTIEPSTHQC
ncbi:unnamed protein product [Calypogeia fissa]